MFKTVPFLSGLILGGALAIAVTANAGQEKEEYTSPNADVQKLIHQDGLASGPGLEANLLRVTAPAGWIGGKHYHTGDVFVFIEKGAVTVETDAGTRTYKAGESFYETPGQNMIGRNPMADEDTVLVVFQVGPKGEPLMVKAD
jgi:quercetin dioxygenase-like cupin family protein